MAKFNPAKVVPTTNQAEDVSPAALPELVEGERFQNDFARFLEQGSIGQPEGDDDEAKRKA